MACDVGLVWVEMVRFEMVLEFWMGWWIGI